MASSIDATKPTAGAALTADVRNNFSAAKTEIEALQAAVASALVAKAGDTMTGALNWATTQTIASAATTDIGAATSNSVIVSGTTTITGLGTIAAGAERVVQFSGALTLTHNATSLILPGGASITTAAGDVAYFVSLGAGNWRCTGYQKANGQAVVAASGTGSELQFRNAGAFGAVTGSSVSGGAVTLGDRLTVGATQRANVDSDPVVLNIRDTTANTNRITMTFDGSSRTRITMYDQTGAMQSKWDNNILQGSATGGFTLRGGGTLGIIHSSGFEAVTGGSGMQFRYGNDTPRAIFAGISGQTQPLTQWTNNAYTQLAAVSAAGVGRFSGLEIPGTGNIILGTNTGNNYIEFVGTNTTSRLTVNGYGDQITFNKSVQLGADLGVTSDIFVRNSGSAIIVGSAGYFGFSDSTDGANGTKDTRLYRGASGRIDVCTTTSSSYGDLKLRSLISSGGTITLSNYTVATLPTGVSAHSMAAVTDSAASPAYRAAVTGGGSTKCSVYTPDGTNWEYH